MPEIRFLVYEWEKVTKEPYLKELLVEFSVLPLCWILHFTDYPNSVQVEQTNLNCK